MCHSPSTTVHCVIFMYCNVLCTVEWALSPRPLRSLPLGSTPNTRSNCVRDVYLGGSCRNTSWREDIAIPMLK